MDPFKSLRTKKPAAPSASSSASTDDAGERMKKTAVDRLHQGSADDATAWLRTLAETVPIEEDDVDRAVRDFLKLVHAHDEVGTKASGSWTTEEAAEFFQTWSGAEDMGRSNSSNSSSAGSSEDTDEELIAKLQRRITNTPATGNV